MHCTVWRLWFKRFKGFLNPKDQLKVNNKYLSLPVPSWAVSTPCNDGNWNKNQLITRNIPCCQLELKFFSFRRAVICSKSRVVNFGPKWGVLKIKCGCSGDSRTLQPEARSTNSTGWEPISKPCTIGWKRAPSTTILYASVVFWKYIGASRVYKYKVARGSQVTKVMRGI